MFLKMGERGNEKDNTAPIDRSMAVFCFRALSQLTVLEHLEQRERRDVDLLGGVHLRDVASRPGGAAGLAQQALEAVHFKNVQLKSKKSEREKKSEDFQSLPFSSCSFFFSVSLLVLLRHERASASAVPKCFLQLLVQRRKQKRK